MINRPKWIGWIGIINIREARPRKKEVKNKDKQVHFQSVGDFYFGGNVSVRTTLTYLNSKTAQVNKTNTSF